MGYYFMGDSDMREDLKNARTRLRDATRTVYETLVYEAKLTPLEERILRLHILNDVPILELAERFSCSDACIRHKLDTAYERVSKIPIDFERVADWRTFV